MTEEVYEAIGEQAGKIICLLQELEFEFSRLMRLIRKLKEAATR